MKMLKQTAVLLLMGSSVLSQNQKDTSFVYFRTNEYIPITHPLIDTAGVVMFEIFGYADTVGSTKSNLALSRRRLAYVQKSLPFASTKTHTKGETTAFGVDSLNRCVMVVRVLEAPKVFKVVSHIEFVGGSDEIYPQSYAELDELYRILEKYTFKRIDLHGHVCCGDEYGLSLRRAMRIKKIFEQKGVDPAIMRTFGHSNKEPIAKEDTEKGRQMNRRVEIEFERE